ncbi:endochitinase A-like [Cynara cardunculus var. scolymus]|uniref:endochitinase A-like n=1 Tax=Cynara cardunculus var. scolymus TaxID=59895 RepID=UPI000D62588A|nr:endochitinase A-like [Cynara cardunculus var. scolymus]
MDSGNSGSIQSSSGADEECDSRAAVNSHAAFIPTHHQPHPPPPPFNHHMFDQNQINNPLFFTASPQRQLLNLDSAVWSKTLPSFSDHHFFPSSSQPTAHTVPFSPATTMTTTAEPITSTTAPPTGARNPKKRSRASRRAPTTVLTTDTSNFRAMVQEFTGIPAPPFTSSSSPPFPRLTTSFDLFGRTSSMMRSNTNNFDNLPQLPPYLLLPFPQKLQSSSASSSSSISSLLDSSNLLTTMQNTISFPSNSLNQSSFLHTKTTQNVGSSNGYGVIGQAQVNELHTSLPDLVSSKGTAPGPTTTTTRSDGDQMASGNWDGGGGGVNYTNGKESSRVITDHHHSSGMKADQGFIEPWICSSD